MKKIPLIVLDLKKVAESEKCMDEREGRPTVRRSESRPVTRGVKDATKNV